MKKENLNFWEARHEVLTGKKVYLSNVRTPSKDIVSTRLTLNNKGIWQLSIIDRFGRIPINEQLMSRKDFFLKED